MRRRLLLGAAIAVTCAAIAAGALTLATRHALMPLPATLPPPPATRLLAFTARNGMPLNRTHRARFNYTETLPLWRVPPLVKKAFTISEDKRYWSHGGADWRARFAALWTNVRAGHAVRGASTIGEQAARILEPRSRSYWSHWIAGFDATRLLKRFGHADVLRFYLNQVPYGADRRGILPAAQYYFGRNPAALSPAEMLALAVLVRSPVFYDPRAHPQALRRAVNELAARMHADDRIDSAIYRSILASPITPGKRRLAVEAGPFVAYARHRAHALALHELRVRTTLDPALETFVQRTLRARLATLTGRGAKNAAALVVDNATGAILAWAVAPAGKAYTLDPVLLPRQPGSALKPFVYALAMEHLGWQADTVIEDTPLAEKVGTGVHRYRNYSGRFYGPVSLRYALANSLNIPAVKTAQAVGVPHILDLFHRLGFSTFTKSAGFYGPAVAIGDGPVRLFDMVQAYATLARHGEFLPLRALTNAPKPPEKQVLSPMATSLLANILSDPDARAAEFGANSVLDLPWPTAVKTGTSSDYRDAWTMGFDNRYTVGVWMGRLGGGHMRHITGAIGPALVLRQVFNYLRRGGTYPGLWRSPRLARVSACEWIGGKSCIPRLEWRLPNRIEPQPGAANLAIARPLPDETLALDPRLPPAVQNYNFQITAAAAKIVKITWILDGKPLATTRKPVASWQLALGKHQLAARVWFAGQSEPKRVSPVQFRVIGAGSKPLKSLPRR
ncbi:MAG: transglycosylase domain-containing protein [Gammaproteobacteria bacterium]